MKIQPLATLTTSTDVSHDSVSAIQDTIRKMDNDEFEKHKEALAVKRLEKPKKLSTLSMNYWSEIVSQLYHFDRDNIEVEYMRTLTKQDIIEHFEVGLVCNYFLLSMKICIAKISSLLFDSVGATKPQCHQAPQAVNTSCACARF